MHPPRVPLASSGVGTSLSPAAVRSRFLAVRSRTEALARPLAHLAPLTTSGASRDGCPPDVSPIVWHLAHTTWFFEQFVLGSQGPRAPWDPRHDGAPARAERGQGGLSPGRESPAPAGTCLDQPAASGASGAPRGTRVACSVPRVAHHLGPR